VLIVFDLSKQMRKIDNGVSGKNNLFGVMDLPSWECQ
jgi:hypothetical protein